MQRRGSKDSKLSNSSLNFSALDDIMRARLENEEKEAQGVKALKEKQAGASIKAVTEEEDEWYWQAVALKTDAKSRFMMSAHNLLKTAKFDAAMGVVIVINSVTIGLEADLSVIEREAFWNDWAKLGAFWYLFLRRRKGRESAPLGDEEANQCDKGYEEPGLRDASDCRLIRTQHEQEQRD